MNITPRSARNNVYKVLEKHGISCSSSYWRILCDLILYLYENKGATVKEACDKVSKEYKTTSASLQMRAQRALQSSPYYTPENRPSFKEFLVGCVNELVMMEDA